MSELIDRLAQASRQRRPLIMAILNTTPDSFSDGGSLHREGRLNSEAVLARCEQLVTAGADLIDIGGESTRPGADPVSVAEELDRVIPAVETVAARFDVPVSVDTSSAEVMTAAALAGAQMINDVRALTRPGALEAAVRTALPVCLMHTKGEPRSMQSDPQYRDVVAEVLDYLLDRLDACVLAGIPRERLLLDPGFGFGKTLDHNLALFASLPRFVATGQSVLVGVSRKSMIGQTLGRPVSERVHGSVALALMAAQQGAAVVRVHDVAATRDVLAMHSAVLSAQSC